MKYANEQPKLNKTIMDKILPDHFHNMSPADKRRFLSDNADETLHDENVTRVIKGDQKDGYKHKFVEHSMKLSMFKDELDTIKAEFKEKMDPHKNEVKRLTEIIKSGTEQVKSDVFIIRDHENERVYTLLPDGELIDDRRMFDHERQTTIQGNLRSINK